MSSSVKMTGEIDRIVGTRVRTRRLELGLSQQKLAGALGLTFPQVQKYENGRNRISVSRLQQIAGVLQMDIGELVSGLTLDAEPPAGPASTRDPDEAELELVQLWRRTPVAARGNILGILRSLARYSSPGIVDGHDHGSANHAAPKSS